jgi:hypothetical protein
MRLLPVPVAALGFALAAACTRTTRTLIVVPETHSAGPSTAATLGVPPGHLPKPGECRVWIPGAPPGQQPRPKSRSCAGIAAAAPAGSWILYRPPADRKVVHARMVDERRAGVIVRIRVFEAESGRFLREENP